MYHGDDREEIPDFASLKAQGIWAIIHKATQGSTDKDPKFEARVRAAATAGLLVGAYHFGDNSGIDEQVTNFKEAIAPFPGIFSILDYEKLAGKTMSPQLASAFISKANILMLYGSDLVRETCGLIVGHVATLWLWLAEYGPHERIPLPWDTTTTLLWQFSGSATIGTLSGHIDVNYFAGSEDDLRARWGKPARSWRTASPIAPAVLATTAQLPTSAPESNPEAPLQKLEEEVKAELEKIDSEIKQAIDPANAG